MSFIKIAVICSKSKCTLKVAIRFALYDSQLLYVTKCLTIVYNKSKFLRVNRNMVAIRFAWYDSQLLYVKKCLTIV